MLAMTVLTLYLIPQLLAHLLDVLLLLVVVAVARMTVIMVEVAVLEVVGAHQKQPRVHLGVMV
jgi:hypothetical protein